MHVAMVGQWREMVEEQFMKLRASGLWDQAHRIFVGLLGEDRACFDFADPKLEVVHYSPDLREYELPTLAFLREFCCAHDCLAFYVHTKGVTRPCRGTREWRHVMEHFVITRYRDCIRALEKHDVCGIYWMQSAWCCIFAGNFWWTTSDYVRTLPDIRSLEAAPGRENSKRWVCERWIGENPIVRAGCLYNDHLDHYANDPCPRSRYAQLREVELYGANLSASWTGLENSFQDLLEPVEGIRTIVVSRAEEISDVLPLAHAAPKATVIGIAPARSCLDWSAGRPSNTVVLRGSAAQAAELLEGEVDVVNLRGTDRLNELRADFELWEPRLRPGGCVLFHDILAHPETSGRFFEALAGRKAALLRHRGLGAWYKV
jgi:hypothetical protein